MSNQKRKRLDDPVFGPFNVSEDAWFYVETPGVNVVAELRDKAGNYQGTVQTVIPWNDIRNALAIKDHKRRAAKRGKHG